MAAKLEPEVRTKLVEAKADLAVAERELEALLRKIASADRAEKQMISEVVSVAFEKLRAAKQKLEAVV